ncbi:MAG: FHA domain-containing protein, partial [Leptospira sp.]|nr:FHA domain-containing protein [Leptospira sp.]
LLPIPSGPEIVENAITDESFIYKKMYGQGIPARRIEQRTQQVEDPGEFVEERESENFADEMVSSGESYDRAVLIQKDGPNPGRQYTISDSVTTIGRSEANDLVLWDSTLSGVHAKIKRLRNKYILFDMVSKKGITLNGKKLLRPRLLYDFDEIRLGRTTLIFRGK